MAYLRFKIPEMTSAAATFATFATASESSGRSVATVASVAGVDCNSAIQGATVAAVASYPINCGIWDAADLREICEERAAIMEYDAGMSRAEAEAAAWSDVDRRTIAEYRREGANYRYYEQVGLLSRPVRTEGKQRRYGPNDIMRLNFIKHGRELGFDVNDIRELLALSAQPEHPCENADRIARRHLTAIDQRIEQLAALRAELARMLDSCSGGRVADCQILESLSTN